MNHRFNEHIRNSNNVNLDRQMFNSNTRQDKNWQYQRQTQIQKHNKFDSGLVNMDRQMFNVNTNTKYQFPDSNNEINDRQFNQFQVTHNLRNRQTTFHDPRLIGQNSRQTKIILKTEDNTFVKRMVNNNPYAKDVSVGVTRIQTIDTKHTDHNKYKSQGGVFNTSKFNPNISY